MSVPGISLVAALLTSVVPAIGAAQTRGVVATSRRGAQTASANRFVPGRLTGTTVRRPPAPEARRPERLRTRLPGAFRADGFGFTRAALASYERALLRQYAVTATAARLEDESSDDAASGPSGWYAPYGSVPGSAPEPEPEENVGHLDWKPGGIFIAGDEPATSSSPASPLRQPVPAVLEVLVPPPESRTGARLVEVKPVMGWTETHCLEPDQSKQTTRRFPRVLGWLYRWARGFDLEKTSTTAPLLYLRSPLLSGFRESTGCSEAGRDRADAIANSCYVVTASNGFDLIRTFTVSLPQLGSRTARELAAAMRQRLDEGETVALKVIGGGVIELSPEDAVTLDVRACEAKTD